MSLCQPNAKFSCGACCGILNLELSHKELKFLLKTRTEKFKSSVNFSKTWTIVEYRQAREKEETSILKRDPTTYVCPFLGYIDLEEKKIGCMIHPSITGNPLSQNFSFYGASICQGYDCKNKQSPQVKAWTRLLSQLNLDSLTYSQIAGDVLFWKYLEAFLEERNLSIPIFAEKYKALFEEILQRKLKFGKREITSFEMNPPSFESHLEALSFMLNISDKKDKLYVKLEGVKPQVGALKE